ncbi:MAG: ABC transporter ATP-binding protein [Thermoguttaceae bacterium]|jgi:ABC-2 type transport system ATP-binding protein|nr:ABC transporter ATP-binding protein [Thermoguttaceae bacterium]
MTGQVVIAARDVQRRFPGKHVLRGADLEIPQGAVVGLLGKNAAGKSTLIKCILGLLRIDGGTMHVFGEDAWWLSAESKARLGYVPQEVKLYPWMRVRQMIAYTAAFYPAWNTALVDRLVREWDLPPHDRIGPLSVGQLQKLAIILALGHEPDLLVLDEPVAALDPVARRDFLRAILDFMQSENRTILFSTHITSDLERVADRVAILQGGRIVFHDGLDTLKESVKRLRIAAASELPADFAVPGALRVEVAGRNALAAIRDAGDGLIDELRARWDATVDVEPLSLEDIFLEMHHAG